MIDDDAFMAWSPVEDEWVLRVPGRQSLAPRADLVSGDPRMSLCPFCSDTSPEAQNVTIRAVPSKHPMVAQDPTNCSQHPRHWVLVYGKSHDQRLGDLPQAFTTEFIKTIARITNELFECEEIQAVFAFESVGDHFGPTVAHPHGQLVGLPFIPRRLSVKTAGCQLCEASVHENLKILKIGNASLAVSPWSRYPFEMLAFPQIHLSTLTSMNSVEAQDLAACIHAALNLAVSTYGGQRPPYLVNVMQAARRDSRHHLRVEIIPLHKDNLSLKRPGGMELGLGVYLNPLLPEDAAELLRQANDGKV